MLFTGAGACSRPPGQGSRGQSRARRAGDDQTPGLQAERTAKPDRTASAKRRGHSSNTVNVRARNARRTRQRPCRKQERQAQGTLAPTPITGSIRARSDVEAGEPAAVRGETVFRTRVPERPAELRWSSAGRSRRAAADEANLPAVRDFLTRLQPGSPRPVHAASIKASVRFITLQPLTTRTPLPSRSARLSLSVEMCQLLPSAPAGRSLRDQLAPSRRQAVESQEIVLFALAHVWMARGSHESSLPIPAPTIEPTRRSRRVRDSLIYQMASANQLAGGISANLQAASRPPFAPNRQKDALLAEHGVRSRRQPLDPVPPGDLPSARCSRVEAGSGI